MKIKVKRLHPDARMPQYALQGDAGMDLFAVEETTIEPGQVVAVPTGVAIELPEGYVSLIWDKSGIPLKYGLAKMGGVIEHTYRGEYKVIMHNTSDKPHTFQKGDKIAQLLIQPIITAEVIEVSDLSDTMRGEGGFGSTGRR